jgi:hypothetical protein
VNTNELEDAIRAELRAEVRQAPAGAPTKAVVLEAVAGLPAPEQNVRHLKRWTVPLLAAAAVVLVAIGLTVGARALTSSRPNHRNQPANQQTLTPPPPNHVDCSAARGETLVNGLGTSYTVSTNGERRYVFEYYCAGSDGHRTDSTLQAFRMVNGTLRFDQVILPSAMNKYLMSLVGGDDAVRTREADGLGSGGPDSPGFVSDDGYVISSGQGAGTPVAQACLPVDLTVRVANAQHPSPHLVLQLTNRSKAGCALWGNPHYAPMNSVGEAGKQPVRYVLRGPAGGVSTAPSAPVILLQPGATAGASIGADPQTGSCTPSTFARVTLPNGIDLGLQNLALCDIVSYPLVVQAAGDDTGDYPTVLQPTGPVSCVDRTQMLLSEHPLPSRGGDGAGMVLTFTLQGGQPCTLSGYPDVRAVDSSGNLLVTAAHTPNDGLGGLASGRTTPPTITLTAGQTASALVDWTIAGYTPTSTCHRNGRIALRFGATGATYLPALDQLCDLQVHPIVSGDTGSQ